MKIASIGYTPDGGAGLSSIKLHRAFLQLGHESRFYVAIQKNAHDGVVAIKLKNQKENGFANIDPSFNTIVDTGFSRAVWNALEAAYEWADIILLRWASGAVSDLQISTWTHRKKPIIWCLSDMAPLTGGCHYSNGCMRFADACSPCQFFPNTQKPPPELTLNRRVTLWGPMTIVSPSQWLRRMALKSRIGLNKDVRVIRTGLELDQFTPHNKSQARKKFGILDDQKVLFFGSHAVDDPRKGFSLLRDSLDYLIDQGRASKLLAITIGGGVKPHLKIPCLHFGYISDKATLAQVYSAADLTVLPYREDNLPNVLLESLACGTPVCAFDVGGMPDVITPGLNGVLVSPFDTKRYAEAIEDCLVQRPFDANAIRRWAVENLDIKAQAESYIRLFNELLDDRQGVKRSCSRQAGGGGQGDLFRLPPTARMPTLGWTARSSEYKVLSIITVVLNRKEALAQCLDCYRQLPDREKIEIIVIDGCSTDGTIDIIEKNSAVIDAWISERDSGIYDAMNKGASRAKGRYLMFVNSDDYLIPEAFQKVLRLSSESKADIIAFTAKMLYKGKKRFYRRPRPLDESLLFRPMPFSHNAILISRELHETVGPYRTDFRIISDLAFLQKAYSARASVEIHDLLVVNCELSGISGGSPDLLREENVRLLAEQYPFFDQQALTDLYHFRHQYSGADRRINNIDLLGYLAKAKRLGYTLDTRLKRCIDENPINFIGAAFDRLLAALPRNHLSRVGTCEPIVSPAPANAVCLVTIGITTYNCVDTIARTLQSVQSEVWPNYEIVIVDDGSTDGTPDFIESLAVPGLRMFINDRNYGTPYTRNRLAAKARGKYLMFCDDDDESLSGRITACMDAVSVGERILGSANVICYVSRESVQRNGASTIIRAAGCGEPLGPEGIVQHVIAHLMRVAGITGTFEGLDLGTPLSMGTGVGFFPTHLVRAIGFHESFRRAEDLEFCLYAAAYREPVYVIGIEQTQYRQYITPSNDKTKDAVYSYYSLLALVYRGSINNQGGDSRLIVERLIKKVGDKGLRTALHHMLDHSNCAMVPQVK